MSNKLKIVGRLKKITISNLKLEINAKIDTGAWSNSLHVDYVYIKDGILYIKIENDEFEFKKFKEVIIRSSFGEDQKRFIIKMKVIIDDLKYKTSFSLTNRDKMKYPCLLGRKFLSRYNFLVDVNQKN